MAGAAGPGDQQANQRFSIQETEGELGSGGAGILSLVLMEILVLMGVLGLMEYCIRNSPTWIVGIAGIRFRQCLGIDIGWIIDKLV